MKTCAVRLVFESICRRRGWDPLVAEVTAADRAIIAEQLNDRVREAWTHAFWPELMETERRQYRATWDVLLNYAAGDEVYHEDADGDGGYYVSLQDANVGKDPDTETDWWEAVGDDFQRTIEWRQDGENEIGAVDLEACVYDRDPRIYRFAGLITPVILYSDGFQVLAEEAPLRPWIRYRPEPPRFSWTDWSAATGYAIEDVVYYATTGHSYKALAANTNKNPEQETDVWEPVEFPEFLRHYISLAVHADYLLDPVEHGKALAAAAAELERLEDVRVDQAGARAVARFG